MHTQIKICGITSLEEVEFINQMDVDYIGFVFAESKRKVSSDKAQMLSKALRADIKKCGVFVESSVDEINEIAKSVNLDIAQVHKNYTQEMVAQIKIPVWRALNIKDYSSIDEANGISRYKNVVGIVADSFVVGQSGGTGKTFNWDLLSGINEEIFLILAGGLNSDNISQAITMVRPSVVDISSGTEESINGKTLKSEEKVRELVRKVKSDEINQVR